MSGLCSAHQHKDPNCPMCMHEINPYLARKELTPSQRTYAWEYWKKRHDLLLEVVDKQEVALEAERLRVKELETAFQWYSKALLNCSHFTDFQDNKWQVFQSNGEGVSEGKSMFEAIQSAMKSTSQSKV